MPFEKGNTLFKGKKHTEEAKEKISKANSGEKHPLHGKIGENSVRWKGNNATYSAIHNWVRKMKGSASNHKCKCSKQAREWANIDHEYSRDLEDYAAMCVSCHKKFDLILNGLIETKKLLKKFYL